MKGGSRGEGGWLVLRVMGWDADLGCGGMGMGKYGEIWGKQELIG